MLARVYSCAVIGLDGVVVETEVDTFQGLPKITIVGLPDAAVQESRERVQSAIKNAGFRFPRKRITVNLAPASVRKVGPVYDLPIALGILIAGDEISPEGLNNAMVIGELSLDGSVRHVSGVLPMAVMAMEEGYKRIYVPAEDANEAALVEGIEVYPVDSLMALVDHLTNVELIEKKIFTAEEEAPLLITTDFKEIKGQENVKRALEVAAAGGHNCLMVGPPGAGKTLLARALPGILPRMSLQEALDVTRIYSIADMLPSDTPLMRERPFRSPHHTISHAGLVGGGNWPQPGEISLAHRGVLFLDELPEFGQRVLEVMRQPLEDKMVTISRAQGSLTFPANFQLVAAMNPCPCGYYGDEEKACTCSEGVITRYQKRISGPLLDRVDIYVEVPRVDYKKLSDSRLGESSAVIRERVEETRTRQRSRFGMNSSIMCNADMGVKEIREHCELDEQGKTILGSAMRQMQLSARGYHRILKLARTIADLAGSDKIEPQHLAEAVQYRPKFRMLNY
ncbi:MAG: YifB family Mg chelatase-like AAA ATPase [Anaerolineales bacterium]|nr:YifB family Mg chelatase-like AAA ATPase [Anaerolineales bacterium]